MVVGQYMTTVSSLFVLQMQKEYVLNFPNFI